MKTNPRQIWDDFDQEPKSAAATLAQVTEWETSAGVLLPKTLKDALVVQNGGKLRYSNVVVNGVAQFAKMDADFWDLAIYEDEAFEDKSLAIAFGETIDGNPLYFLNFNANGPKGEPSVYRYFNDTGDFTLESGSVDEFVSAQTAVTDSPSVSMQETAGLEAVLHRETLSHAFEEGGETEIELVAGRLAGLFWVYRREKTGAKETIEKIGLAEPLDPEAIIETSPAVPPCHSLRFDTRAQGSSVEARSEKMPDGKWKNLTRTEALCAFIESRNKEQLIRLRAEVLGPRLISRAENAQRKHDELAEKAAAMAGLPEGERRAIGLEVAKCILKGLDPNLEVQGMDGNAMSEAVAKVLKDKTDQFKRDTGMS